MEFKPTDVQVSWSLAGVGGTAGLGMHMNGFGSGWLPWVLYLLALVLAGNALRLRFGGNDEEDELEPQASVREVTINLVDQSGSSGSGMFAVTITIYYTHTGQPVVLRDWQAWLELSHNKTASIQLFRDCPGVWPTEWGRPIQNKAADHPIGREVPELRGRLFGLLSLDETIDLEMVEGRVLVRCEDQDGNEIVAVKPIRGSDLPERSRYYPGVE